MNPISVVPGDSVVVLAMPHSGTWLPDEVKKSLNDHALSLIDTDWHIDQLYHDLLPGATVVKAHFHRYLIDANRDPSDVSLYPGQNTTGLCPLNDFDGKPLYRPQCEPDQATINHRLINYHAPYHQALELELQRVKQRHGVAVLYDCHSIRSQIDYLFEGQLPVFNLGTFMGRSCAPALERAMVECCKEGSNRLGFNWVLNGRFKGGWTTRHYGQPEKGVHAIQMELAQRAYLEESPPWSYLPHRAEPLRDVLKDLLQQLHNEALQIPV